MLEWRYTVGRLKRSMELFFAKTRFQKACQLVLPTLISCNPKFPSNMCSLPPPPICHTPSFSLQYPCLQDLSLTHVSVLSFLSISPWIMPSQLLTESCLPTGNKFLRAKLCNAFVLRSPADFPGKKKSILIHCASSVCLTVAATTSF